MHRSEFLKLSATIIGGLGIPGFDISGLASELNYEGDVGSNTEGTVDDTYLVKGLTAMVRANGWFDAHWGAGVIAGYYLCKENQLGDQVKASIKAQLDAMILRRADQFMPLASAPADEKQIDEIVVALGPAVQGGLRAHGHAVIFASLSVRALRDVPHMAVPSVIRGLANLSHQIAKQSPQKPPGTETSFGSTQEMIEATFDSLARFQTIVGRPSILRPNFTHMTTHTEALMNLDEMGYSEVAKLGHTGLRAHISVPVPEITGGIDTSSIDTSLATIMSATYWNDPNNYERWKKEWKLKENPNGDWIASGHLFKVLYSYHRLIKCIQDQEKVSLVSKILLERYVNPEMQGG